MTTTTTPEAATETEWFARLAPKLIDPDPDNRTTSIDPEFRKSVQQHGVLEPVLVVPHPDTKGRYLLVAGERRWRAATAVGCADIPAMIDSGLSETDRVVRQITENLHRLDLAPAAEANQFMRLATLGMNVRDLATQLGRSQRYVRDRLKIAELPRAAQKLIDERQRDLATLGIATKDHTNESCHAWIVQAPSYGTPKLVAVCTKPRNHSTRGASTVKATTTATGLSDTEAATQRAARNANTERLDAIAAAITGKVTKTEASDLIARALLDSVSADDARKAAKVLGIEGNKDTYWPTTVTEHAAASDAALQRTALAIALVTGNRHIHNGRSDQRQLGTRAADFLKARGWKPSAHDRSRLKALKTNTN